MISLVVVLYVLMGLGVVGLHDTAGYTANPSGYASTGELLFIAVVWPAHLLILGCIEVYVRHKANT